MVHVIEVVLIAVDHLAVAVTQELSSRYCPVSKGLFLIELFVLLAIFCVVGLVLIRRGNTARLAGIFVLLFAVGGAALDLFGLSGCGAHFTPGLTWDHPW